MHRIGLLRKRKLRRLALFVTGLAKRLRIVYEPRPQLVTEAAMSGFLRFPGPFRDI